MLPASWTLKIAEQCNHTSGYYPSYVINYGCFYFPLLFVYQVAQLWNTAVQFPESQTAQVQVDQEGWSVSL